MCNRSNFTAAGGIEFNRVLIDFPLCSNCNVLRRHSLRNFFIPTDESVALSCRISRSRYLRVVVLRNRSNLTAAGGVKGYRVGVRYPFCIQCYVTGDFIACIIPRRAVGLIPASEGVAQCGGGIVGTRRKGTGGQYLPGVYRFAVHVSHGWSDDRVGVIIDYAAVEKAPVNTCGVMTNPKNVSESGDAGKSIEAGDGRILSDFNHTVYLAAVGIHSGIF